MSSDQILQFLSQPGYKPMKAVALAKQLGIGKKDLPEFREALRQLLHSGEVQEGRNGLLRRRPRTGLISGLIKRTTSGFGFLIPAGKPAGAGREGDIYISRPDLGDAQTGDEVLVELVKPGRQADGKLRGRVVEVIQRASHTFVGSYLEEGGEGYVQVDGNTFTDPISVGDPGAKGAVPGDKVVFEMIRFPSHSQTGEGVLTEVLGARGAPGVDTLSIIAEFGLPDKFPENVLEEARVQAEQFQETDLHGRLDLTGETIVTIDPADARDFDDAISLTHGDDGHWHLGVHIADVSQFVRSGSALDHEAQKRGTSVYLPDRVLPMLPEILSNSLASLQQGKVRYTKSVFIEFDAAGVPLHTEFANSAIKVTRRFAYEEVMATLIDPSRAEGQISAPVLALLQRMYDLAMQLRARRFVTGALELTMPEVKIDFDKEHKVSGAHLVGHDASHQIIEEFMLAANVAVATELADRKVPFLRRVHGDPDEAKLKAFAEFVNSLGFKLKRFQSRHELQKLLDRAKQEPTVHAVNYALLRSMKQAQYAAEEIGHYALAAENYCHFTSPIRRYPDLTVHRLVGEIAAKKKPRRAPKMVELVSLGKHCSATERRAADAERELVKVKLLTYMASRVGEELDAMITGVQDFGIFCQGVEIPAEGLVHVSALSDDYYYYEAVSHSLIGRRSGRQLRLGDKVRVVVAHVDVDRRILDFRLAAVGGDGKPRSPRPGEQQAEPAAAAAMSRPPRKEKVRPPAKPKGRRDRGPGQGGKAKGKKTKAKKKSR
jgi:ribonuclease R